ncbi:2-hydroxyacid dehydrogenase [Alicyclobacillus ferrooxydans]|uniref:2-ketogluconate reductase n=1 Tax=Alicyclobacillus ferrooxydans TaxID=471514 RepID=A0A0P9EJX2_9BACL|nr:D-glycerate dehydrogenase [Alicyclobacillus ferrooxydans]KPV43323.1 hypothetical protein AN477_12750 [Alicyclobacillus ferrooxydans]
MRPKVYVTRRLPDDLLEPLSNIADITVFPHEDMPVDRTALLQQVNGVAGIVSMLTDRIDEEVFAAAGPSLQVVANMAVGYDNIDREAAIRHNVMVTNTPDVLTETTADLVFGLLLATARRIPQAEQYLRTGQWKTWSPMLFAGTDVFGKTLGIVGMGRIGQAVAKRALGFGMRVLYHNRRPNRDQEATMHSTWLPFDELLRAADFVVVLVPGSADTAALFGVREFALMKPSAIFINAARGTVVDESALVEALSNHTIHAAGLDVYQQEPIRMDHPLLSLDNAVLLPHIGSASVATRRRMAELAIENCVAVITGRPPIHRIV